MWTVYCKKNTSNVPFGTRALKGNHRSYNVTSVWLCCYLMKWLFWTIHCFFLTIITSLFVWRMACYCVLFWIQWPGTCLILELGILVLVPSSFSESGCRPKTLWVAFTFYVCCNIAQLANLLTSLHDLLLCRFWPCLVVPGWVTHTSLVSTWPHCHMRP